MAAMGYLPREMRSEFNRGRAYLTGVSEKLKVNV